MLQYADKVVVFGGVSLFSLDQIDIVITGKCADAKIIELLIANNIQVYLV